MSEEIKLRRPLTRREFLRLGLWGGAALVAGAGATSGYAFLLEPGWLDVTSVPLRLPRLPAVFDGLRVVQISDIHLDLDWMTVERLAGVIDRVIDLQPDVVLLTGDYVSGVRQLEARLEGLSTHLARLEAPLGVFAVLGNHDHWVNPGAVRRALEAGGAVELRNAVWEVQRGGQSLFLCGVDDYWERKSDLNPVLATLPPEGCAVLLAHEPDFADFSAATGRFDLQVSGHSHGGQVVAPFYGPIVLPSYGEKYPSGLYTVQDMWQYTNRGVGMTRPRVRINCRPEITVFTFQTPT